MEDNFLTEHAVERYLVRQAKQRGITCKKISGWRGWPDRMLLYTGGITHWIETKRPKNGRFEPLQLRTHRVLRNLGFTVLVIINKHQVDDYFDSYRHLWCTQRFGS